MSCTWNEWILNLSMSINWRASLVPAAAVIPAPIAYIKVVAVKKLVVGVLPGDARPPKWCVQGVHLAPSRGTCCTLLCGARSLTFTLRK